jgi:flagellar basal-body rod protein FlgG
MSRNIFVMIGLVALVIFGVAGCGRNSSTSPTTPQNLSAASFSMFSGKSFDVPDGTLTFNANGTLTGVGINVAYQTWSVNSSGQLVVYATTKGTATYTLSGDATKGWTGTITYSNGTTEAITLTPVTSGSGDVTVTGKVAGTTFVAVDADSALVVARHVAAIQKDGSKIFSIKVPSSKHYKFYLIENVGTTDERVFPLYFGNGNKVKVATGTCDLGFVTTSFEGIAIPAKIPTQFTEAVEDKTVPDGVATSQSSIYSQADLTGTWYTFQFASGINRGWLRTTYTIDATGVATPSNGLGSRQTAVVTQIGNEMDVIIQGAGFFAVTLPDGTTGYSKSGNFKRDSTGQIVTSEGNPLSPSITIPSNATTMNINSDGTVSVKIGNQSATTTVGNIPLASFSNPSGLTYRKKNIYLPTVVSGAAMIGTPGQNGLGTIRFNANGGISQFSTSILHITPSGIVSNAASSSSTKRLVMSQDKSLMIGVGGASGEESMFIAVKGGGTFPKSDLTGSWKVHALTTGEARNNWERMDAIVSSGGVVSTSNIENAQSRTAFDFFSEPLIVPENGDFSGMNFAMSRDKNIVIFVCSNQDGTSSLGLFVKTGGYGVSTSDLAGNWWNNSLTISATSDYWNRSVLVFDANGNSKTFAGVMDGVVQPNTTSTNALTIGSSGLINPVSSQKYEGILSLNRKLVLYTQLRGANLGQFQFGILIK